ncbi:cation efflux family protein [Pyrenophora tritici-repentis]|nr:cation efflux family protein [Pyrenophora tritici-repentis]KAI0583044.1 cation efflux family protein [Pyrenophora tritici-repentis]KAI0606335.1 cation efflux family protein [Pyrenophora tritici-repentis]
MVGRRNILSGHHNGNKNNEQFDKYQRVDLEHGYGAINPLKPKQRFRDAIEATVRDNRANEMKQKLIDNVDHDALEVYRKSEESLKSIKNKKVRAFYEEQNQRLDDWAEVDMVVSSLADDIVDSMNPRDPDHDGVAEDRGPLGSSGEDLEPFLPEEEREKRRKSARSVKWAINVSIDRDELLVGWRIESLKKKFPIGRRRLEPIGILVFSIVMVISFLQILQESIKKLLPSGEHDVAMLPPAAIFAMVATIVVKGTIWIGCARVKTTQVQALAQDCKTDVYFNTLSLLFPLIGAHLDVWWLDPLGAAGLSLFIIYDWACTCFENVARLTGEAADARVERKMMFMAYRFAPLVEGFKSLKCYHAGDGVCVEIDVLMNEGTPLRRCHDIAETLQYCLEGLKEVDRAFVTMDYTSQGPTGHAEG